jgi:hypothetical protein
MGLLLLLLLMLLRLCRGETTPPAVPDDLCVSVQPEDKL